IMTIHKAKGLEFPVVIYPFAHTGIYDELYPRIWFPLDEADYGIPHALLNKNRDIRELGDEAAGLYDDFQSKLELDQFNILYVALTRAVERLYIITKKDTDARGAEKRNCFSGLFIHYLKSESLWNETETEYTFGTPVRSSPEKPSGIRPKTLPFMTHPLFKDRLRVVTRAGSLWDALQPPAERIKRYRHLLSGIVSASDVSRVIRTAFETGAI
ncbi:MAG: hypothetical protein KDD04_12685, partial [Sinomicrobium sp.]|nr:hypothetical protein [Sinomicrobium sp.]